MIINQQYYWLVYEVCVKLFRNKKKLFHYDIYLIVNDIFFNRYIKQFLYDIFFITSKISLQNYAKITISLSLKNHIEISFKIILLDMTERNLTKKKIINYSFIINKVLITLFFRHIF